MIGTSAHYNLQGFKVPAEMEMADGDGDGGDPYLGVGEREFLDFKAFPIIQ